MGKSRILYWYLAFLVASAIVIGTNLIPQWGMWYSDHLTFRWETENILQGRFAMANDASGMNWDLAWGTGTVQQIWGLGVPLWRVPFEWIAKLFGQNAFPDR